MPHGVLLLDMDGRTVYANAAFQRMTGWTSQALTGTRCDTPSGLWQDATLYEQLREAILRDDAALLEGWCHAQDGQRFWAEWTVAPLHDDEGARRYTFCELRDIEAWRRAREDEAVKDKRYRDLIEHIPAGVVVHGRGSEIILANQEASRLLGLSLEQMMGRVAIDPRWHFQHEDGTPFTLADYPVNRVLATRAPVKHLVVGIQQPEQDRLVWVMCNAFPVLNPDGDLSQVVVSFTDVTDLKQAELDLQRSEERLQLVLRGSNDAPWDWDMLSNTLYYSPRWWQMIGYEVDELPADTGLWMRLLHPDDVGKMESLVARAFTERFESYEMEFRLRHKQGHYVPVLSRGFLTRDADGKPLRVSGTNLDLTERKRAEAQIHHLAFYDALTELPNRRFLVEQLRKALLNSTRSQLLGALLFIDLDHFKELNDTQGHEVGDELLRLVAHRLVGAVRQTDTVARLGGDEFVVMLEGLHADSREAAVEAERVAQKILDALNEPYSIGTHPYRGTPSIGIALFNGECEGVDALLRHADLAMYQAKSAGRNTMRFFDASMQAAVEQRVALEANLRDGLLRGELRLHVQPQVDMEGRVIGAEALVRWAHPLRGLLGPAEFITLAEATGLILPLGRWVLERACAQLAQWAHAEETAALTLAVNVSAHQFRDPGFVEQVLAVLAHSGARPSCLKLELTESVLADNLAEVTDKITRLRSHGVAFSLDDFGTGYSSLGYLKHLPLDQLKIDASFVRDVFQDPSDATLVRIIITLARELGLSVIAEGVETDEQRRFLADHGCGLFQGYLFSRPMPIETFGDWLQSR